MTDASAALNLLRNPTAGDPMTRTETTMEHTLTLIRDEQRKRGWYLSWRCTAKGCQARGNSTTPDRETGISLFGLAAEGHRQAEG